MFDDRSSLCKNISTRSYVMQPFLKHLKTCCFFSMPFFPATRIMVTWGVLLASWRSCLEASVAVFAGWPSYVSCSGWVEDVGRWLKSLEPQGRMGRCLVFSYVKATQRNQKAYLDGGPGIDVLIQIVVCLVHVGLLLSYAQLTFAVFLDS